MKRKRLFKYPSSSSSPSLSSPPPLKSSDLIIFADDLGTMARMTVIVNREILLSGKVNEVPVIRIYGSTPAGQKTCLHVHRNVVDVL